MAEYQIVAIRLSAPSLGIINGARGRSVQHIEAIKAVDTSNGVSTILTVQQVIACTPTDTFFAKDDQGNKALVEVVNADPKYIRTEPDESSKKDNLLSLPVF
jgi:hypothetical protein